MRTCPACNGDGLLHPDKDVMEIVLDDVCPECQGDGTEDTIETQHGYGPCDHCGRVAKIIMEVDYETGDVHQALCSSCADK